ncbi:MAG: Asp-tRNA(Asn)/Glu-tRNA(Gln) amidotransferase subunit GatC [Pseudomonadales bacterium]|jgi:aspartyl-tRNA(Asn)/glutamyl-tRNA(Gln) amidotransferase subunit C|nr:Asp-tRNA(Asn)/Glu-tRNA(Gln) amidotransferase subunit GatC [Pseudomonadales bacterium]
MSIDSKEIEKLADLARLKFDQEQLGEVTDRIASVLDFIDQLHQTETQAIEPMAHPMDAVQRLRADKVTESNQREKYQQVAPATENGLYLVPKVIE